MKDLIIGSHLSFAREGELIDSITVAVDAKPDNDPAENYTKLGCVEQYEPQTSRDIIERRCPKAGGGRYRTRKRIPVNQRMTLNFSMQEWDEMTLVELLHNADKPNAGAFVPNSRDEMVRGWLHIQNYDQNDNLILDQYVWVELTIESYQFGEQLEPYALVAEVLESDLNSGDVTNL